MNPLVGASFTPLSKKQRITEYYCTQPNHKYSSNGLNRGEMIDHLVRRHQVPPAVAAQEVDKARALIAGKDKPEK